jgi:outer membrane lipoprotein-sorting protein
MRPRRPPSPLPIPIILACAALAALIVGLASPVALASDWDIAYLMDLLAHNKGGVAAFTEKKFMAILDGPLVSSGELLYTAPDHLEKRTLAPKPESFVLDGDVVTIKRGKKKYTLPLQDYPKIAVFIESIRGTLAGDRKALERSYRLSLDGAPQQWTLTLTPTDSRMTGIIQSIFVHGKRGEVRSIEIHQADGDYSVMTVERPAAP